MVHTGIFATKAECDAAAGENVDATGYVEANINAWCLQAESIINCVARHNFSDSYATDNADVKYILTAAAASYVAMMAVIYNMAGYTTRVEAEDMLNIHRDNWLRLLSIIKEQKVVTFINDA
jgi:hypothetical protein